MKNKFMKKLAILCSVAVLTCSSASVSAASAESEVPAVMETVQVEAASATAMKLDATLKKNLDKVIKAQKFTKKTTNTKKLQKLFNYTKKHLDIRDIWAFHLHQAGTHSLQKKCFRQRREAVTMMRQPLLFLQDVPQGFR